MNVLIYGYPLRLRLNSALHGFVGGAVGCGLGAWVELTFFDAGNLATTTIRALPIVALAPAFLYFLIMPTETAISFRRQREKILRQARFCSDNRDLLLAAGLPPAMLKSYDAFLYFFTHGYVGLRADSSFEQYGAADHFFYAEQLSPAQHSALLKLLAIHDAEFGPSYKDPAVLGTAVSL